MESKTRRAIYIGALSGLALFAIYFLLVGLISGLPFAFSQFRMYWYFFVGLALGFALQMGIYVYLKLSVQSGVSKGAVAVSGTSSTLAMISCCSHYLVNLLPIVGIAGVSAIISQYQVRFFWVGIIINALAVSFMLYRLLQYKRGMNG